MVSSKSDQKRAEIVRRFEDECLKETQKLGAVYELRCLEVEEKYEAQKKQAYRDLKQQELKELDAIKRLFEAEMKPLKAKHEEKLSAIREQYRVAGPEAGTYASAIPDMPSSPPALVTASTAKAGNKDSVASNRVLDDTQESGEEIDTSIPAVAPRASTKETFAASSKKRRRGMAMDLDDVDESNFFENENDGERDGFSDVSLQESLELPSGRVLKPPKGASAQRSCRNNVSFASPTKTKNDQHQKESTAFETRNKRTPSSRQIDGHAEGRDDDDEGIYSGPASQATRRNRVRPGRPEPGKYRMSAKAWPV